MNHPETYTFHDIIPFLLILIPIVWIFLTVRLARRKSIPPPAPIKHPVKPLSLDVKHKVLRGILARRKKL